MAVAYDAGSESYTGATTGSVSEASFTWDHTPVGTARGVLVFVITMLSDVQHVTSVTADGSAVPAVSGGAAVDSATEPGRCDVFFLGSSVPAGTLTMVVNRTNDAIEMWACCITVTAAADTEVYTTGIVLLEGDGTLAEQNVDDGSPGTNSVRFAGIHSGLAGVPAAGANSTVVHGFDTGSNVAQVVRETTAGQGSRPVGFSDGTTDDRAAVHLAVREAGGAPANKRRYTLTTLGVG